jgi:hypothetical protein
MKKELKIILDSETRAPAGADSRENPLPENIMLLSLKT